MLVVGMYLLWVSEFLLGLCRYRSAEQSYRHISLECEAHANERDAEYIRERPLWGWSRYLRCRGYAGHDVGVATSRP